MWFWKNTKSSLELYSVIILTIAYSTSTYSADPNHTFFDEKAKAVSYPERIAMLEKLALEFGLGEKMCPESEDPEGMKKVEKYKDTRKFGVWGAHFVNTNRQFETGRDEFTLWSYSNFGQVVIPSKFGSEFLKGVSCLDSPTIEELGNSAVKNQSGVEIGLVDICLAWNRFFSLSRGLREKTSLSRKERKLVQHYFWAAHSLSNFHSWSLAKDRFEADRASGKIPKAEARAFNGYARYVSAALPRDNSSSCSAAMWPYLDEAIPQCILGFDKPCKSVGYELGNSRMQRGVNFFANVYLKTYRTDDFDRVYRTLEYEVRHYGREIREERTWHQNPVEDTGAQRDAPNFNQTEMSAE